MSPQGTTLASKAGAEMVVDAYVDALLAMPVATGDPAPPAAAPPAQADDTASPDALDAAPMPDAALDYEPAAAPADAAGGTEEAPVDETSGVPTAAAPDNAPDEASVAAMEWPGEDAVIAPDEADAAASIAVAAPEVPAPMPPASPRPATSVKPVFAPDDDEVEVAPAQAPVGQRWLRVAVGDDRYAVELLRVQEVVRLAPLIAVRGAVPSLLGVMNLRGRVVPVHDLGRWLRRAPVEVDERSRIVVLEFQDELVGLLVTAVTDVVTLDGPQIEPPTRGLRDRIGMGIARTPGAPPTVLLDARVVFD